MNPLLQVRHLSKTFPGVKALDDLSLEVASGEVVALLGHNGSGKSTLIKLLAEVHRPDPGGDVELADGVAMHFIHQDLGLVHSLSALENLDLSRRLGAAGLKPVARRAERVRARQLLEQFGARFDLTVPVAKLTPAERSVVAIARALDGWTGPRNVLVLDEPTAALHGEEVAQLLAVVRRVADAGAAIVYVSHRLDEVLHLADRVVVLRDGRVVAALARGSFDHDDLVTLIAGRTLAETADGTRTTGDHHRGRVRLAVRGLHAGRVAGVELEVRSGEVVGVSGVVGSGMEHLAGGIFGATPRAAGSVEVDGKVLPPGCPDRAVAAGVGFVPADRRRHGAVVTMNARENVTLPRIGPTAGARLRLDHRGERADAGRWLSTATVRPHSPERAFALFSGGNQQKIVLAKWLRLEPAVLLLEEPTQGVDVGARASIYELVAHAAGSGAAVLVASSDAKELAAICDRVLVFDHGAIVAEISRPELTEQRLVEAVLTGARATSSIHGEECTR